MPLNWSIFESTQSAVFCSVPRSIIWSSTFCWPMTLRNSVRISTVVAGTSSPVRGLVCRTFFARFQYGAMLGVSSSGSATAASDGPDLLDDGVRDVAQRTP